MSLGLYRVVNFVWLSRELSYILLLVKILLIVYVFYGNSFTVRWPSLKLGDYYFLLPHYSNMFLKLEELQYL